MPTHLLMLFFPSARERGGLLKLYIANYSGVEVLTADLMDRAGIHAKLRVHPIAKQL